MPFTATNTTGSFVDRSTTAGLDMDGDALLSPNTMLKGGASEAELERHCTPTKLKRYIALHLERLIEHEEV